MILAGFGAPPSTVVSPPTAGDSEEVLVDPSEDVVAVGVLVVGLPLRTEESCNRKKRVRYKFFGIRYGNGFLRTTHTPPQFTSRG